jgi:rod shape-determining protein MreD
MIDQLNPNSRRDRFGSKINRTHSPLLAFATPWLMIMVGSGLPVLPMVAGSPWFPPFGYLLLLSWRMIRPGVLPLWAGIPLGLVDDLFSGQPFGSAVLLWSLSLLAIEGLEARFPWRGFVQDWLTAAVLVTLTLAFGAVFAGTGGLDDRLPLIGPQVLLSLLLFPMIGRMVASFDRLRLLRIRTID